MSGTLVGPGCGYLSADGLQSVFNGHHEVCE